MGYARDALSVHKIILRNVAFWLDQLKMEYMYINRVRGSTGAMGAWAPAKVFQWVPGVVLRKKKLVSRDPVCSKIGLQ